MFRVHWPKNLSRSVNRFFFIFFSFFFAKHDFGEEIEQSLLYHNLFKYTENIAPGLKVEQAMLKYGSAPILNIFFNCSYIFFFFEKWKKCKVWGFELGWSGNPIQTLFFVGLVYDSVRKILLQDEKNLKDSSMDRWFGSMYRCFKCLKMFFPK